MIAAIVTAFYAAGIFFAEVTASIVDEKFAGEMEAMFEADFAHAEPIDPENLKDQPLWW